MGRGANFGSEHQPWFSHLTLRHTAVQAAHARMLQGSPYRLSALALHLSLRGCQAGQAGPTFRSPCSHKFALAEKGTVCGARGRKPSSRAGNQRGTQVNKGKLNAKQAQEANT